MVCNDPTYSWRMNCQTDVCNKWTKASRVDVSEFGYASDRHVTYQTLENKLMCIRTYVSTMCTLVKYLLGYYVHDL